MTSHTRKCGRDKESETQSLLISAQNNAIRIKHIKAKIDKTQQNNRCRQCGDRYETINHINECRKLAQKEYKTRHDCVCKVIHWELCKKLKIDHTNKWYMHNPISILENETQTPLGSWDTNRSPNLNQTTRPNNNQQKKENLQNCGLCCSGWP